MYKWFLAWRYLHTKLIAFFGVAAVSLCVAMVLVVLSVMGGFLDTIRERSRGLHSEIVLDGGSLQGFPYYEEFDAYLQANLPDVVRQTTPVIYTYGIFRVPATKYTKSPRVLGIRLREYAAVNTFGEGLHYDRYYPGSTHLGEQQMPVAGLDESMQLRLPADLEAANLTWRGRKENAGAIAAYDEQPFEQTIFPYVTPVSSGERVYASGMGPPRYEGAAHYGLIVGCDLLHYRRPDGNFDRYLARGADIALTLMPLSPSGNLTGEPPVRLPLRYTDDSRTGIYEIDSMSVYVDFDMLQHKLAMDPQSLIDGGSSRARTCQLLIGLHDGVELNSGRDLVDAAWTAFLTSIRGTAREDDLGLLGFVDVMTWEDLQRPFIAAVEKEKVLVTFLFGLISMVAIVLVGCIFYMIVEKKTRDIGILKALGASGRGIGALFITYAAAVGIVGSVLGVAIGCAFVWNINGIQDFLASLDPQLRVWSPEVYSFDKIPEIVKRHDAIGVGIAAILASMLGSLIPSYLAARVWPVNALRHE